MTLGTRHRHYQRPLTVWGKLRDAPPVPMGSPEVSPAIHSQPIRHALIGLKRRKHATGLRPQRIRADFVNEDAALECIAEIHAVAVR